MNALTSLSGKPLEQPLLQPQKKRWPLWKKVVTGVAGAAAAAALAAIAMQYFQKAPPPLPRQPCIPGINPECSGPRLFRQIVLGTIEDDGGNAMRREIAQLVDRSHAEYAKRYGYDHKFLTKSLVAGKCLDPDLQTPTDCVPYWNKIEMFRQWLAEPKKGNGIEEWRAFFDSDMPVTNRQIKLDEIIDLLRDVDSSVIVTRDGLNWQKGWLSNPEFAINTGLLIVRKDEAAKQVFDAIWARRNDPVDTGDPLCRSLGTCKNQKCLHEQEAFANLLHEQPGLAGTVVSIVKARDPSSLRRGHIALNTYHRPESCFKRKRSDRPVHFVFHRQRDPDSNWVPGDFTGQTPVVPVYAQELPFRNGRCVEDDSIPFTQLRLKLIQDMCSKTIT